MRRSLVVVVSLVLSALAANAQQPGAAPSAMTPDPNMRRPIDAVDSVFIEDLTWLEVRDAMRAGKKTVLIATGGVEQNGPYLVTGKHNVVLGRRRERSRACWATRWSRPSCRLCPRGTSSRPAATCATRVRSR